jgi:CubicO group peptidase (beta-lactamase class C family)
MKMKLWQRLSIAVTAAAALLTTSGGYAAAATTKTAALDQAKLDRIEAYVEKQFEQAGFPGGAFAVVDHGKTVRAKGIGYSDMSEQTRATSNTLYAAASVTKPMTAAAVLQLAEQQRIELDAPVRSYLPWFQYKDQERSSKVTIGNLLTHSAGVSRYSADGAIYQDIKNNRNSRENAAKALQQVPMNSEPGAKGQYCNTCYNLLGLVIEEVTGQPYETYMQERLFEPLGMKNTTFAPQEMTDTDVAKEYGYLFGFQTEFAPYWKEFGSSQAPEGGVYTSAEDLARFVAAALEAAQEPDFAAEGVAAADLKDTIYTVTGYEAKTVGGTELLTKSGEGMGSSSEIVLIPSREIGFVLLVGESDGEACGRITDGVVNLMLDLPQESGKGTMPNMLQTIGFISLAFLAIGAILLIRLIVVLLQKRHRIGSLTTRRLMTILARIFLCGTASVPLWYLLLKFRPTEAGFYGYPYDLAIAMIVLVAALSLWTIYSFAELIVSTKHSKIGREIQ